MQCPAAFSFALCLRSIERRSASPTSALKRITDSTRTSRHVRKVPILLQKSFCIDQHKFSGPYARRSNDHLRDYIICDELTGDFGNRARSHIRRRLQLVCSICGKFTARHIETFATLSAMNRHRQSCYLSCGSSAASRKIVLDGPSNCSCTIASSSKVHTKCA